MNILRVKSVLLAALVVALSTPVTMSLNGCSQADRQAAAAETNSAYADFKAYVEGVERDVARADLSDTEFSAELNRTKADYEAKLAAVERDADQFTTEQRADIEALKTRYRAAFEQREAAYRAGVDSNSSTGARTALYQPAAARYATLTVAELRPAYEQLVRQLQANEDRYGTADWAAVKADWQALNARKEELESQLSVADRAEIAKEKVKFAAIKTFDQGEARAAEGADSASNGAYRAGQAIGRGANRAGKAIDRGAEKVGDAAKEVFRGVRDASKDEDKRK